MTNDEPVGNEWHSFADALPDVNDEVWLWDPLRGRSGPVYGQSVSVYQAAGLLWAPVTPPQDPVPSQLPALPRWDDTRGEMVDRLLPLAQRIEDYALGNEVLDADTIGEVAGRMLAIMRAPLKVKS